MEFKKGLLETTISFENNFIRLLKANVYLNQLNKNGIV